MRTSTLRWYFATPILLCNLLSIAQAANYFNVTETGGNTSAKVRICLNATHQLGCQLVDVTSTDLSIKTSIPNQTYTNAGIATETPGFTVNKNGRECTLNNGSLCGLSDVSTTTPAVVHTIPSNSTGNVKCWGLNSSGQLGYGDNTTRGVVANQMGDNLPVVDLGSGRTAKYIGVGGVHTCALLDNGTVKCWGLGGFGALGYGDNTTRGNAANQMGDNLPAVELGTGRTVVQLSVGGGHNCVILDNGTVKCWGANANGQLGIGDNTTRGNMANQMGDNLPTVNLGAGRTATRVVAGNTHTCAILDNNTLKCWGNGAFGALGSGDTNSRGDGANEMGDNLPIVALGTNRTVTQLKVGNTSTCVILDDRTVKCWGLGGFGRLGTGNTNNIGDGANEMGDNLAAISLGTGRTAKQIGMGSGHVCAKLDNNTVKCWGLGSSGQLGYEDGNNRGDAANQMGENLAAVNFGSGRTVKQLEVGNLSNCVYLDNNTVKCWGINTTGVLGYGDNTARGGNANDMGDNLAVVDLGTNAVVIENSLTVSSQGNHACVMLES